MFKLIFLAVVVVAAVQMLQLDASASRCSCSRSSSYRRSKSRVQRAFISSGLVPDLLDYAPKKYLTVIFANNTRANLGNELTPCQVNKAPTLKWRAKSRAYYTLMMVSPDYPSRANATAQAFHWVVMNIPGRNVELGDTVDALIPSAPAQGAGLARYALLVFMQSSGKIDIPEPYASNTSIGLRFSNTVANFTETYDLGRPIFGNFYQAQWDTCAATVLASLTP